MEQTLTEVAQSLKNNNKKVQLIYAFNGVGKTRLSREFKELIDPKESEEDIDSESGNKIMYYNAFTEDLFYWDNDLDSDVDRKLKIQPNSFTDWIIRDRGQDQNIIGNFQRYTDDKLTPSFIEENKVVENKGKHLKVKTYPEVVFSFDRGTERSGNVKISKGEESCFIWSVFYTLLEEIVEILDQPKDERDDIFLDKIEYVFIDDPVSSLDDNHLIELAVDIADLVKSSESDLKFIITTHNPLFYNVVSNELNNKKSKKPEIEPKEWIYKPNKSERYRLDKKIDGKFLLSKLNNKTPFSYHLFLLSEINEALKDDQIRKYHFSFLRNILEKTATFLGHNSWQDLLPKGADGNPDPFANRILNLSSHSAHGGEEIGEVEVNDKEKLHKLIHFLSTEYKFLEGGN